MTPPIDPRTTMVPHTTLDRRTLLKLMGTAGVSAAVLPASGVLGIPLTAQASGARQSDIESFEFHVSAEELEDLGRRLASARWPGDSPGEPWSHGTDRAYLQELVSYWRDQYDWRAHEAELNSFNHFTTTIDGQPLHFVHHRGRGANPMPLVMTHGWPGTIWEILPSIRALTDPAAAGGNAADSFDVVAPSIPGFGFSGEPAEGTDAARTAELWVALMEKLGYRKFGAYGSDWGALISGHLGERFSDRLFGLITPGTPSFEQREPRTEEEREFFEAGRLFRAEETAYQQIQGTKPQTLAYGLTDSAVGLAGWLTEKLRKWSDCHGDLESRFSKDQILTLVSIYWHTRTIGTSMRYYHANGLGSGRFAPPGPTQAPRGYAEFPADPWRSFPPRTLFGERPANVTHWTVHDTGGHFPAIEETDLLVEDIRTFFRPLRAV
jgi:pimeloyl-ACP methyl ester carboxylesterase